MNSNSLYLHTYLGVYSLNNNNNNNNSNNNTNTFLESPLLLYLFLSSRLIHWSLILKQGRRVKLATTECKTHWGDMETGGCNALDFTSHDSYMLNTDIFMRPLGHDGIYHVLLYNLHIAARG